MSRRTIKAGPMVLLGLLILALASPALAQRQHAPADSITGDTPFYATTVGVYVSKRGFRFNEHYYQSFAAFLQENDSLDLSDAFIKLGMTIRLGNYLTRGIQHDLGADSAFFINATPSLAQQVVADYRDYRLDVQALKPRMPEATRFILLVDSLRFKTATRRSFFAVSNQIRSERRTVKKVSMGLTVYDLSGGEPLRVHIDWDEEYSPDPKRYLSLAGRLTNATEYLDVVFNLAFSRLFITLGQKDG